MKYGGNTACLELKSDRGDWLIFDAGTGLRVLGGSLDLSKKYDINIVISHPHWDHINGFPFFTPIYIPGNSVTVHGPSTNEMTIGEIFKGQMTYSYFPVRTPELVAKLNFRELQEGSFTLGNFTIDSIKLNHPVDCLGYKVKYEDKIFIYLGDNEPYYNVYKDNDQEVASLVALMRKRLQDFVKEADVLVADSQYLPSEYEQKVGWGHSTTHDVINMSVKAGVKRVFFFHHEPLRTDDDLDQIVQHYRSRVKHKGLNLEVDAAMEGKTFEL